MADENRQRYEKPQIIRHESSIGNRFGAAQGRRVLPAIDGVSTRWLIEEHGSPLFVFSERKLRAQARATLAAFRTRYPRVHFTWSYKTNNLDAICGIFHQEGWAAEVVSLAEYQMARRLGCPGDRIIFNGACKPAHALALAIDEGALIQIDHFDELDLIAHVARRRQRKARVGVRINMMLETLGITWDRFGFNLESGEAMEAIGRVVASKHMELESLHCHMGTQILQPAAYGEAAARLGGLVHEVERLHRRRIEIVNLGGGFPSRSTLHGQYGPGEETTPEIELYADAAANALKSTFPNRRQPPPLLYLESGRMLVDEAGTLLATVMGARRLPSGGRGLVLDAGVNLLYTATWYRYDILPIEEIPGHLEDSTLYGPLCMAIDVIRSGAPLPPLQAGHVIAIRPVGAYNLTQWMQFSQMRPAVVMVCEDGTVEVIRRAEVIEDLKNVERLPERFRPDFGVEKSDKADKADKADKKEARGQG